MTDTRKRVARVKLSLTKRTVEALRPADRPWTAWDDKLTGFASRTFLLSGVSWWAFIRH